MVNDTTHPWVRFIPEGILIGSRHGNVGTPEAYAAILVVCAACEWEAEYPCHDLRGLVATAETHRENCRP